ncbi:probable cytochrome P450 303a1 [Episyrphus balteatus]|uniref:probable cytochrome P450 303a1 n=1 Tax=Episyrphus balteatus TaxID=286459 RepID=UPI002485E1A6|nr:probable cytochrome P450 303a1 [Episyrphus balteatus]
MFYTVIFFFILILIFLLWDCKKPDNFPPGPRWYPIVGCALQLSQLRIKTGLFCRVIDELVKTFVNPYGVYGLKIGKDQVVVAYYKNAIQEMGFNEDLDGRPQGIFYRTRTFNSKKGILLADEDFWVEQRRFIIRHLKDFGFSRRDIIVYIQEEAQYLADDIRKRINKEGGKSAIIYMQDLFPVFVLNSLWRLMASKRYDRESDDVMALLNMFYELLKNVDMIGSMFSQFPFMRYVAPDFSGFNGFVESHHRFYAFLRKEVEEHRQTINLDDPPRDLMDAYLQVIDKPGHPESFSDEQLLSVCLDLFLAGSETTNKSLGFAFLHMAKHPEIQEKAQAELDSVVGRERQPCWEDKPNLPYCEAIVYEALRFFMGHTFGVPHRALKDTRLCGYNVPKDTMVVACFRGMLMNSKDFPDPHRFWPDRYFIDGKFKVPDFSAFGYGRHRCMGEMLGKQNIFFFVTTLLQSFTFKIPKGEPIPSDEPIDGVTAGPQLFNTFVEARW